MSGKGFSALSFVFLAALIFASSAQAGPACRLEKEVPGYAISGISPITAKMFDSRTGTIPLAEQDFRPKELKVGQYASARGSAVIYRVRMDFTNTDLLALGMDLWWELWIGGNRIGGREKVPQSAFAILAADADTVDGLHSGDLALSVHGHGIGDISGVVPESQIDSAIARDSEVSSLIGTHDHDAAYVNEDVGEVGDADILAGSLSPDRISGTAWTSLNDGSASGLDADMLDGQDSSSFAAAGHAHPKPVAAFAGGNQNLAMTSSVQVCRAVTIAAPSSGTIIVNASGYVRFTTSGEDILRCSITTNSNFHDYSYLILVNDFHETDTTEVFSDFGATRGYNVSAGSYTYRLLCDGPRGGTVVEDSNINAIFIPN